MSKQRLFLLLGLLLLGGGAYFWMNYSPPPQPKPPEELVGIALNPETPVDDQQRAVLELPNSEAAVHIRQVMDASSKPEVKAAAVLALARVFDWDSMPKFFEIMEDFSADPRLRANAGSAATKLLGKDYFFRVDSAAEEQHDAIDKMKALYQAQMTAIPDFMKKKPEPGK
jgi:hypothetical protein